MKYKIGYKFTEEEDKSIELPLNCKIVDVCYVLKQVSGECLDIGGIDRLQKYHRLFKFYYDTDKSDDVKSFIQQCALEGIPKPNIHAQIIEKITYLYPVKE
jgi:hypothetical protein